MFKDILILGALITYAEIAWFLLLFIISLALGPIPVGNVGQFLLRLTKGFLVTWLACSYIYTNALTGNNIILYVFASILFLNTALKPLDVNININLPNKIWAINNKNKESYRWILAFINLCLFVLFFSNSFGESIYVNTPTFQGFISILIGVIFIITLLGRLLNCRKTESNFIVKK